MPAIKSALQYILFFFAAFHLNVCSAELYKVVGPDGKVSYTDKKPQENPKSKDVVSVVKTKISVYTPSSELTNLINKSPSSRSTSRNGLRVYTASWCGYCKQEKAYLKSKGIPFEEVDIETPQGQQEYAALGGNGIPISIANGKRLDGFTEAALDQLLKEI